MSRREPLFLEQWRYRRRRLMDAIRLLPLLGFALWMVPLLWQLPGEGPDAGAPSIGDALTFIFGVWLFLVLVAFTLWTRSRATPADPTEDGPG